MRKPRRTYHSSVFYVLTILCIFTNIVKLYAQKDIDDVKKQAEKAFENEDYVQSYKLYSQLAANFSKEPLYNYRLGVSMIYAEPNKKKCISYLEFAVKFIQKKETPPEALFYLGKAYHLNYRFEDAIKYYKQYKQEASSSKIKELEVDKEILACENGKKLLSNIKDLVVLSKKRLNEQEYFRSYDLSTIGGKLLVKPDEFKTKYDKKKKDNSIIYLPQQGDKIFFSSYGEDGKNGKDIYYAIRLPNGTFAKPQPLSAINTPYDEDFPFLHPNGKVLYFASKGHKGMGGYDIFKSTYDESTQTWSTPENLEFPINSPGDEFLFVTDIDEKIAFFSTSRYAPPNYIDVLKIKTERVPPPLVAIKGKVRKTELNQSIRSVIAVKNIETGDLVGTFAANENGEYYMELPNGGKFLFTVETPGFTKQSEAVNLPLCYAIKPLAQSIAYEKNVLVITNYFDEPNNENAYLDIVEFIEKKAQLEVNEQQFKQPTSPPISNTETTTKPDTTNRENTNQPKNKEDISATNTPIPPDDTKELLNIVKKDIEETHQEVNQLEIENNQLQQVVQLKNQELQAIEKNIQDTQNQLNTSESKEEKEQLTQLLKELQNKRQDAESQKQFFEQYQKEVQNNLENKKIELETNQQFASALQELEKGKNKDIAISKLEQLQKKLQELEQQQKVDKSNTLDALDKQEKEKQQEIAQYEKQKDNISQDIQLLQQDISQLKTELTNTKDNALKENIQTQIDERENELKQKQNALNELSSKIEEAKSDITSIKEQKELLAKIKKNEPIKSTQTNTSAPKDTKSITNATINQINQEYQAKINSAKTNEEKIRVIEEYNQLLTKSIEENKKKISNTSNSSEKQKIQNLNSELEQIVKSNNEQLVTLRNKVAVNDKDTNQQPININKDNQNGQEIAINNNQNNNQQNNQQKDITLNNNLNNNQQNISENTNQSQNISINNNQTLLPIDIPNQQELLSQISRNEQLKSEFSSLKNQFENQLYQAPLNKDIQKNAPSLPSNSDANVQSVLNIINATNQSQYFSKQADSIRKIYDDFRTRANNTTDNNQKQKLLAEAKKYNIMALEKEYQAAQFSKTLNQNVFNVYDNVYQTLSDDQKQKIATEYNNAKQAFKQAEQIRKEASNQSNLSIKLAAEQNAQEKEQIAISTLTKIFKDNNVNLPTASIDQSVQNQNQQIQQNYTALQKQYILANNNEIQYLMSIADTSQALKKNPSYAQSLNQLQDIYKTIQTSTSADNLNNATSNQLTTVINNQLQLIQQLRQITSIVQPVAAQKDNLILKDELKQNIAAQVSPDTALGVIQKIPMNITANSHQQLQTLIQEQKQIVDNIQTENPVVVSKDDIIKTNETLNTQIAQLTNKALSLKQQISQTNDQKKKSELQTEFERVNADIQEKKTIQLANEILINQSEFSTQNTLLNQLVNSIPANNETEKNNALSTINEIQKLKKQEEGLIKEALSLSNPSAQLGALQNVRIKQEEYMQKQQELINQLSKYNPDAKKQNVSVNVNDPFMLSLKYQSNVQKQIKEWESVNNNLNIEITRLYPKYSNTPSGKILADAQKLIAQAKNTNDKNKKLELYIQAAQLQQKAMQELSAAPSLAITDNQQIKNNTDKPVSTETQKNNQPKDTAKDVVVSPKNTNQQKNTNEVVANNQQKQQQTTNPLIANTQKNNQQKNINTPPANTEQNNQTGNSTNPLVANVQPPKNEQKNNQEITNTFIPQIKSIKVAKTPAYSKANPIPLNPTLPEGLIFSVQVGAFRNPLPNDFFKGISPIFSQTTDNNLYRYLVGQMSDPQEAIALRNNFRNLGYADAFVIAYYNGKRISFSEALDLLKKKNQKEVKVNPFATTNVLEKANIPTYKTLLATTQTNQETPSIKDAEEINDLYFTIQIGVYGKDVSDATFKYIKPIIRNNIDGKFYRYSAGIYNDITQIQRDLNKVVQLGMKDAFICAYWNGKRIFYPEAQKLIRENKTIRYASPQPIQFPDESIANILNPNANVTNAIIEDNPNAPPFDPRLVFSNGVTKRPEPTPENGVKADNTGICYRVQIGAFRNRVPKATAEKYFKIKDWPIEVHYINGLYIYTIGNFVSSKYAAKLRQQVVELGINDAFITVYKDNKKLFGYEALKYLNQ